VSSPGGMDLRGGHEHESPASESRCAWLDNWRRRARMLAASIKSLRSYVAIRRSENPHWPAFDHRG
jgi:hypothetical protein